MSIEIPIVFKPERMPTFENLQNVLSRFGLPLSIDSFDLKLDKGFVPAKFNGQPAGFEYFLAAPTESEILAIPGTTHAGSCIRLITHADLNEFLSSIVVAGAICEFTNGHLIDPDSGEVVDSSSAESWVRHLLSPDPALVKPPNKPWWRFW